MACNTPSQIIGIDSFAQTLHSIVSEIVYKVKEQQATAALPLEVDKEWIMGRLREQISEGGYTIEPKDIDSPNALGPFFNKIPQELRNIIFADCLASGYPQFMAASQAMREEGLGQIWEKGVFRMNFGIVPGSPVCPRPTKDTANKIQHLSVRVARTEGHIRDFCSTVDLDTLKAFGGSEVPRRSCQIFHEHKSRVQGMLGGLRAIVKTFVGFKDVEMRLLTSLKLPRELSDGQKLRLSKKYAFYGLGPWSIGMDNEGLFMRFHPREAQMSLKTTSPGKTTLAA